MPPEYYDDEWQAQQREKTKELRRLQREEEEEEERKIEEYREIGMRLKEFPEEDLRKARKLVSSFIRAAEEVEERIEEAAEKGELDELVLMIIWNRLDLARRDVSSICFLFPLDYVVLWYRCISYPVLCCCVTFRMRRML